MGYSMSQWLTKKKKWGHSDFMQIGHKEFIGYDIKNKRFFTIFYDNKYREDVLYQDVMLKRLKEELKESEEDINERGLYNTREEYNKIKEQITFINKYKKLI